MMKRHVYGTECETARAETGRSLHSFYGGPELHPSWGAEVGPVTSMSASDRLMGVLSMKAACAGHEGHGM